MAEFQKVMKDKNRMHNAYRRGHCDGCPIIRNSRDSSDNNYNNDCDGCPYKADAEYHAPEGREKE